MIYSNFKKDLEIGHSYELLALEYLDYDSYEQADTTKKISEYDLIITKNNIETKIEVKADLKCQFTGNIAIEYSCNNKKSGITTSEAKYWVVFVVYNNSENVCYKFPIKDLKRLCKNCLRASGGDGYRSRLFLLPVYKCKKYIINKNSSIKNK